MTEAELKRSLIAKINQIQDPAFLKALLIIADSQPGNIATRYSWSDPATRHWLRQRPSLDFQDTRSSENFFEDMEQLLRDNNQASG